MLTIPKNKWLLFGLLLTLVMGSNVLVYHAEWAGSPPPGMALGSLFDFIITVPLLVYVFIIRKRYSLKYVLPVMIAGYGAAGLIIPKIYLLGFSFVKYILFAGEGAFLVVELYVIFKLLVKIPAIIRSYRTTEIAAATENPTFQHRMEQAWNQQMRPTRVRDIFFSEMTMVYYSIFSWRKKPISGERSFTYHKKTGAIALYIMLIHALVLESVGFHFLLHSWNPTVAIIALGLNIYTLLFFVAEIQAIRLCPMIITDTHLYLQVGFMKRLTVPLKEIKSFHYYQGPEKLTKVEAQHVFDATVADFMKEKPTFELEFVQPAEAKLLYGFKKRVRKAHLRLDEPQRFYTALSEKMNNMGNV
ncbi:hypothetical protein J1P26_14975 [Neobacillus sp. MM2021_6]|uniref:hypothetical protein n=1 Tax=Bacillaceae TaxID=186817 RepID=UPI00140C92FC|nr:MULTISPECIES: hypothetical protein [Bacillaceae]MBO0961002.1 hypothetical protein [Neobacillus sp. MM2021_6]NHC19086.1 hypothetical protein [Bacillus sp. MM2020_4]